MTAFTSFLVRSRSAWSLGGTMVVHAALAALILRQPVQSLVYRLPNQRPLEFQLREGLSVRKPLLSESRPAPPRAPVSHARPQRSAVAPAVVPSPEVQAQAPPPPEARDLRKVDLLPGGVLRRFSEQSAAAGSAPAPGAERVGSPQAADARLAHERVQGFVDSALARNRVQSGLIDSAWRDLEADVLEQFKPTESLVRSGQTSMSLGQRFGNQVSSVAKQILGSTGRLEPGPVARGEFAERGPMGLPENSYRVGLAAQQTAAVVNAWKKPAGWRRTEAELVISAVGEVESLRILSSCGVKKLDAQAVEAIEKAARKLLGAYRGKRTITTWALESAYAANVPVGVTTDESGAGAVSAGVRAGFSFDESGLGRKNARGLGKYFSDPEYLVGGKIHTKVSLLSLREPPE